jgi:hypothetical protein
MRLTNIQNLVRGDKVRAQFEKQVLAMSRSRSRIRSSA